MAKRIIVGDVLESIQLGENGPRLLQFVAVDQVQLNSDVVVVYSSSVTLDDLVNAQDNNHPIEFYTHTTVRAGIDKLWRKVGRAAIPDLGSLLFKAFKSQELVDIEVESGIDDTDTKPYWYVWTPLDSNASVVDEKEGEQIIAEPGNIYPPSDIMYRIKHGQSEFGLDWSI